MSVECEKTMLPQASCSHCMGAGETEEAGDQIPFIARYSGVCNACGYDINKGDRCVFPEETHGVIHERC